MADDVGFTPEEEPSDQDDGKAIAEKEQFSRRPKPNTVIIPLWKNGHISFDPDGSIPIFAVIALALLLVSAIVITAIGAFGHEVSWLEKISSAIGYAITGVVGAIVGSSVGKGKDDKPE